MGACGCNETNGVCRVPGKNKTQYIIGYSVPCQYCDSPVGITIDKLSAQISEMTDMMSLPELREIDGIKLIDLDKFRYHLKAYLETLDIHDDDADIMSNEIIWDCLVPTMKDTIYRDKK